MNAWDEANIPITSKYEVTGYPTIIVFRLAVLKESLTLLFRKGDEPQDYARKDRTALAFLKLAYTKVRPYDSKLSSVKDIDEFLQETYGQSAIIGFFDSETDSGLMVRLR
jgi:hypothetical protein